ncbi:protein of unknown function [Streptomyces murinus]
MSCRAVCAPWWAAGRSSYGRASDLRGWRGGRPSPRAPRATCGSSAPLPGGTEDAQVRGLLTVGRGGPVGSSESTTGRPTGKRSRPSPPRRWVRDGTPHRGTATGSQAQRPRRRGSVPAGRPGVTRVGPGLSRQRLSVDPQPAGPRSARRAPGPHP